MGLIYTKERIYVDQRFMLLTLNITRTHDHYEKGKRHKVNQRTSTPGEGLKKTTLLSN